MKSGRCFKTIKLLRASWPPRFGATSQKMINSTNNANNTNINNHRFHRLRN